MNLLKITTILFVLTIPVSGLTQEKITTLKQNKVLIYAFKNKNDSSKYRYLSRILPKTITLELKKNSSYKITSLLSEFSQDLNKFKDLEKKQNYLLSLCKKYDSDFIVMGSFIIDENGLKIEGSLFSKFDLVEYKIDDYSTEKGAELVKIIDSISIKLGKKIALSIDEKIRKENTYIEKIKGKSFSIKPFFQWNYYSFDLFSDGRENEINFVPNVVWKYGINFTTYDFTFNFSTNALISSIQNDEDEYGDSSTFDINLRYYWKYFAIDAFFQYYKGFYVGNTDSFIPTWQDGDPYAQLSDMKTYYGGMNLYFIVNGEKFSYGAVSDQTEQQKKTASSLLIKFSMNYFHVNDEYSLIPATVESYYGEMIGFHDGKFYTASISPGFFVTITFGNFFFTPSFFLGAGGQYQIVDTSTGEKKRFGYLLNISGKGTIGYNGDSFISGITFFIDNTRNYTKDAEIDTFTMNATYFIGVRF